MGDYGRVRQMLLILLDNAVKFSHPGGAVDFALTREARGFTVEVTDHGRGIPPEELPLLFDRFHKTDASRSEDRDGVGLGLYIVKSLIGNLKEQITATSEDGVTQFQFTLTLA